MSRDFTLCLIISLILSKVEANLGSYRCDGAPEGQHAPRTPADGRFRLFIEGNPNTYISGTKYSVSLRAESGPNNPEKFAGFALTVEPSKPAFPDESPNVGTFSLFGDALTTFSVKCPNTVIQANNIPKAEITVMWTAPPSNTGCVVFRATVVESRYLWYMHDGHLSRTLCEDIQDNLDEQPEILERCCACDEAKYEVTFEGLWSRHTHPKDFPSNGWLTRFSDIIGASHTGIYRFWEYDGYASDGLKEVAERGTTHTLESELKANSQHIRTIIKARGISYPNITGKTFAVFRVDRNHHLMSLVSKIDPSPDWLVGVSGLELCQSNCSWLEFKVLNLKPWDAGTDNGTSYISPSIPTIPQDRIRRINSRYPAEESNPFYDSTGEEMKPLARLYLTRQRIYEKSCSDDSSLPEEEDSDCSVTKWSPWSRCEPPCVSGSRHRQRSYLDPDKARIAGCTKELTQRDSCIRKSCNKKHPHRGQVRDPHVDSPECQVTDWGDWSDCTATCGKRSYQTRSRKYRARNGLKHCGHLNGAPELQETRPCQIQPCEDGEEEEEIPEICHVTEWSDWTPCSATCGTGYRMRSRLVTLLRSVSFQNGDNPCKNVKSQEEVNCTNQSPGCENPPAEAKEICSLSVDPGPCQSSRERWYFDIVAQNCKNFTYYGCQGNQNNFLKKEDCLKTCSSLIGTNATESTVFPGLESANQVKPTAEPGEYPKEEGEEKAVSVDENAPVDCKLSKWGHWSSCSVTCGVGIRTKTRRIRMQPKKGGAPCEPSLVKTKHCRPKAKCDPSSTLTDDYSLSSQEDSSEILPTWGDASPPSDMRYDPPGEGDCILSSWSSWSPCSATCGLDASRQRTRYILKYPSSDGKPCGSRVEVVSCGLLSCMGG